MKVTKVIKYVLSLIIAAILLFFSFKGVDWDAFMRDLDLCNWHFIIAAMVFSIIAFYFRSQRWKYLLRPIDPTMDSLTTYNGVCIGYLANFVFPRAGELLRCGLIQRHSAARHPDRPDQVATFDKSFGTVLMSRSWDVLIVFLLMGILLVARWSRFGAFFVEGILTPFAGRFSTIPAWTYAAGALVLAALVYAFIRFGGARLKKFARGIAEGFISWAHMPTKWQFFAYTILMWLTYWAMSYSIVLAMPQLSGLTAVDALFISVAGGFGWMVPVPGGFGAYHGIVALALSSVYALDWDTGIMCATLNHEAQSVTMLVCGIISYVIETFRKK